MRAISFVIALAVGSACAEFGTALTAFGNSGRSPSQPLMPGTYNVSVKRDDSDLYRVNGQSTWIKTQFCLQLVISDSAVLSWNGKFAGGNKIVFSGGQSCDVVDILSGQ